MVRKIAYDSDISIPEMTLPRDPDLVSYTQNVLSDIVILYARRPDLVCANGSGPLLLCVLLREMHAVNSAVIFSDDEDFHILTFRTRV